MLRRPLLLNGSTSHQYRKAGGASRLRIADCGLRIAFLWRRFPSAVVRWYNFPGCAFQNRRFDLAGQRPPPAYRGGACIISTATMLPKKISSTIPRPINIPFRTGSFCSFCHRNGDASARLSRAATGSAVWSLLKRPFSILPKSSRKFSICLSDLNLRLNRRLEILRFYPE